MSHNAQNIEHTLGKRLQFSKDTEIANLIESAVPAKCQFKYHTTLLLTYLEKACSVFLQIHNKQ